MSGPTPLEAILAKLDARRCGEGWSARCPAHDDRTRPCRSPKATTAGCFSIVRPAATSTPFSPPSGLTTADLFPPKQNTKAEIVATYDYTDEAGALLFQVVRCAPKSSASAGPDGRAAGYGTSRVSPCPLPAARCGRRPGRRRTVFVCEGEKDVDALVAAGEVATCNPMGAGKLETARPSTPGCSTGRPR